MPLAKGNLKGLSNMSGDTRDTASTMSFSKYAEPAEPLDWTIQYLTDKHVRIYETCNKYKVEMAKAHFDYISKNYEGMYLRMGYPDPQYVATYVQKMAKKSQIAPSDSKILDFACGTGLVGQYLNDSGFTNIIGLDISPNMLEVASNKGVYSELEEYTIGNPSDMPMKFRNSFDFVTCSGLVNNNHMDYLLFEEMLLSLKKGGYSVFAARFSYMGHFWYDEVIQEMHDSGRWKLVATETFFKYDKLDQVSIGRFSKTPCKVFVFQKTQDELVSHLAKDDEKMQSFLRFKSSS